MSDEKVTAMFIWLSFWVIVFGIGAIRFYIQKKKSKDSV